MPALHNHNPTIPHFKLSVSPCIVRSTYLTLPCLILPATLWTFYLPYFASSRPSPSLSVPPAPLPPSLANPKKLCKASCQRIVPEPLSSVLSSGILAPESPISSLKTPGYSSAASVMLRTVASRVVCLRVYMQCESRCLNSQFPSYICISIYFFL